MPTPAIQNEHAHAVLLHVGRAICEAEKALLIAAEGAENTGLRDEIEAGLKHLRHVAGFAAAAAVEDKEAA